MRNLFVHAFISICILFIAACPAGNPTPGTVTEGDALVETIDAIVMEALEDGPTAAISVAVAQGSEIVAAKGYGYADVENEVPATAHTVYRLGSVTKQFTSVALMRLVEAGEISLDDEITRFLPDYSTQGQTVRVHHLLNHTSGIKSYTAMGEEFWGKSRLDLSHDDLVEMIADEPFDFAPGTGYAYNNSGYYLLGMILEEVTGDPYAEHLSETIFEPLGLEATSYCRNEPIIMHRAAGYARREGELVNAEILSMTSPFSAGALCSTVLDLVEWQWALNSNRLVDAATYERMITPETLADGAPLTYGYGLSLGAIEGHAKISHGGGINGFNTTLAYYPDDDVTIVVLANTEGANPGRVERLIAQAVLDLPEPEVADLPIPAEEIARNVGTYALGNLLLEVSEDEGRLVMQTTGQEALRLLYQGDHRFIASDDEEISVVFAADGEVAEQLTVFQGGGVYEAQRIE